MCTRETNVADCEVVTEAEPEGGRDGWYCDESVVEKCKWKYSRYVPYAGRELGVELAEDAVRSLDLPVFEMRRLPTTGPAAAVKTNERQTSSCHTLSFLAQPYQ